VPRQSLLNLAPLQYQATQASLAYLVANVSGQTVTQAIANRFEWNAGRLSTYGCDFSDASRPACAIDLSQSFTLSCSPTPGVDAREAPLQCRRSDNAAGGQSIGFVSGSSAISIVAVQDFPIAAPGLPGGQVLGPTYDYTQRLLDFTLLATASASTQDGPATPAAAAA
jgi:hypothetical protein